MHLQLSTPKGFLFNLCTLLIFFALAPTSRAEFIISSRFGNLPVGNCNYVRKAWDLCGEANCDGKWQYVSRSAQPCIVTPGPKPSCHNIQESDLCRRVSGSYSGWGARNGLLDAYFKTSDSCWWDFKWFFAGGQGTNAWAALRDTNSADWINIEFATTTGGCAKLK